LKALTKLRHLGVYDTQVTSAGKKDLKRALPNLEIEP
jgi:hypothetical protein